MKYLLVLLVVVIAVGVWRSRRRVEDNDTAPAKSPALPTQDMVACAHCGLHLPRSDALALRATPAQYYCSPEHRAQGPA